jgi:hypothetical protein
LKENNHKVGKARNHYKKEVKTKGETAFVLKSVRRAATKKLNFKSFHHND